MNTELIFKIDLAIKLLTDFKGPMVYDKIIGLFKENGITQSLADDIYIFLPIVFCKKLLPDVKFPDSYYQQNSSGEKQKKMYDENIIYKAIEHSSNTYFKNSPDSEMILKIASLSAEFNVINNLLMEGGKLEDVKLTETVILK